MPLFKSQPTPAEERVVPVDNTPTRKHTLFGRRRSVSPSRRTTTSPTRRDVDQPVDGTTRRGGFFGGRRRSVESNEDRRSIGRASSMTSGRTNGSVRSGNGSGFFGRNNILKESIHKDPSIIAAKEKVTFAEKAEVAADEALVQARAMVREAKDHVRLLEREAAEEAKRAKAKQAVSNDISRSAGGLGRHGM
ncbi:PALP domain-containing protein [Mycena indigotica]|uniref:PALP domain-containing protein n=1 Tax=Mycena indigotica TaxID=2126181 RepID=A0A8H6WKL3_9AGAR|nr:PALP domain-containing protein [Mycena indigotica]KAF7315849.1 PALP domain-containing protein [Mycena indigotica]